MNIVIWKKSRIMLPKVNTDKFYINRTLVGGAIDRKYHREFLGGFLVNLDDVNVLRA